MLFGQIYAIINSQSGWCCGVVQKLPRTDCIFYLKVVLSVPRIPYVPATLLAKLWRALIEFKMLAPGDKILIGLSGGKDSMFLTAALAEIKQYAPLPFELVCYTVDTRFSPDFPQAELADFCAHYGLTHYHEQVNVQEAWQGRGSKRGTTPCFTCAYFRRAATNRKALELGCNKIAWAHHHDDAVETFMLNLLTSGQLRTFLPVTPLSRTGLTVLRPLVYYREAEIVQAVQLLGLTPLKNPCPFDGHTKRQAVKEQIVALGALVPEVYEHLGAAMRTCAQQELWPAEPEQKELVTAFRAFWQKSQE